MLRRITFLLCLCAAGFSACTNKKSGCDAAQICTDEYRSAGIRFVDKDGNTVEVKNVTVVNLRTGKTVTAQGVIDPGFLPDFYIIANDSNKGEFSTDGDEVKITATSVATGKTAMATVKLSGGCNCHISKISGPDKVVFE